MSSQVILSFESLWTLIRSKTHQLDSGELNSTFLVRPGQKYHTFAGAGMRGKIFSLYHEKHFWFFTWRMLASEGGGGPGGVKQILTLANNGEKGG